MTARAKPMNVELRERGVRVLDAIGRSYLCASLGPGPSLVRELREHLRLDIGCLLSNAPPSERQCDAAMAVAAYAKEAILELSFDPAWTREALVAEVEALDRLARAAATARAIAVAEAP